LWDDRRPLGPGIKLLAQAAAALILFLTGVSVSLFEQSWLNFLVTIAWVVGITNALNLLDNMDGLSGGVSAIAALFFLALATMSQQILVGSLAAALLGACLGFLWYNFNPARIFMGDSGSLFIGFILAALGIKLRFIDHPIIITWMVPIMVLGVPIFDSTLVVISRLRRGKNPLTTPGKDHLSHRLVLRGFSHREAVLSIYVLCGAFGVIGILLAQTFNSIEAYALSGAVFIVALGALVWLERVYERLGQ
jgi:UDP-GlcNAc:undecaprenyl-phosphate GlcNAc-1-phosphate transferase